MDPSVARAALAIDATGDEAVRARAVAAIRAALATGGAARCVPLLGPPASSHSAPDPARLGRPRAEARPADIDIGE